LLPAKSTPNPYSLCRPRQGLVCPEKWRLRGIGIRGEAASDETFEFRPR